LRDTRTKSPNPAPFLHLGGAPRDRADADQPGNNRRETGRRERQQGDPGPKLWLARRPGGGPSTWPSPQRPEGCTNLGSRRGLVILVEQTAEEVSPIHVGGRRGGSRRQLVRFRRWGQAEPSVWSLIVVMADVDSEHPFEMRPVQDEEPVKALRPHCPDPALRVGVRFRCPHRRADHLAGRTAEALVKGRWELAVPVTYEKPEAACELRPPEGEVSRLLRDPNPSLSTIFNIHGVSHDPVFRHGAQGNRMSEGRRRPP